MSMIRIDPQELEAAASTMRGAAVELADIGSQLASCVSCPLPPDVEPIVTQYIGVMDRILDVISGWFSSEANDLTNRAAIASTDLVSAGSVATAGAAVGSMVGGTVFSSASSMTIGGNSSQGFTVVDPNSGQAVDTSTLYSGIAMVGGVAPISSHVKIIDPTTGREGSVLSSVTIGGGTSYGNNPAMILAQAAEKHRQNATAIGNRILANPNSTASDISAVYNSRISMNDTITRTLAPSRSTMEDKVGHLLTLGQYYDLVPEARPPAGSII